MSRDLNSAQQKHSGRFVVSEGVQYCVYPGGDLMKIHQEWWANLSQEQRNRWNDIEERHRIWWSSGRLGPNPRDEWTEPVAYGNTRQNSPSLGEVEEVSE